MKKSIISDPMFVGRDNELGVLMDSFNSVSYGKGKTIFVTGEAGSGKTRLINEFLIKAQNKDALTITGWCLNNAVIPYFPFIEAFRHYSKNIQTLFSGNPNRASDSNFRDSKSGVIENSQTFAPQVWMDQVFATVMRELAYLSAKKPTVLVLEDVHWADSASLALLHYISRSIRSERVLVLATFRKEELNSDIQGQPLPLLVTLRSMSREDLYEKLELSNLNVGQIGKIAESALQGKINKIFEEKLFNESQGNPLFVIECIAMLLNEGSLTWENGEWSLAVEKFTIPLKIRDIILQRLATLKIKYRRILDVASVIGDKFDSSLIGSVLGQDSLQILEKLNLIAQSTSLVCCESDYFRFDHAKTREAIYESIPTPLKIGYHSKIAERLEKINKSFREFRVSDLAYHYQKAGNKEKSLQYALAAGNDALLKFSNAEAIKHFTFVLENSPANGDNSRLMAIEGIGDALLADSRFSQSGKMYDQLCDSELGVIRLRGIRKAIHAAFLQGNIAYSTELIEKAESISHLDQLEYARVRASIGWAIGFRGNIKGAIKYIEESLSVFQEANSTSDTAEALYNLSELYVTEGRLFDAIAAVQRSIMLYRGLGDFRGEMEAYFRSGHVFFNCGLLEEAWESYCQTIKIGANIGDYNRMAWSTSYLSLILETKNQLEDAISQIKLTEQYAQKTDSYYAQAITYASYVRLYAKLGKLDLAQQYHEKLVLLRSLVSSSASKLAHVVIIRSEAVFYAVKGEWQTSFACFEESLALLKGSLFASLNEHAIRVDYYWALKKRGLTSEAKNQNAKIKSLKASLENKFDQIRLNAFLIAQKTSNQDGDIELRLELINVSKKKATLLYASGLMPPSFVLSKLPLSYYFENGNLNFNGKNIPPFSAINIKFSLKATKNAVFNPDPIVVFEDESGNNQTMRPVVSNPANLELDKKEKEEKSEIPVEWGKLGSPYLQRAFEFLAFAFVDDYGKKRLPLENSGWKTLSEISKYNEIPLHSIYGRNGHLGKVAIELERKGLIEKRFQYGQRGRGGKILRVRINYNTTYCRNEITKRLRAREGKDYF